MEYKIGEIYRIDNDHNDSYIITTCEGLNDPDRFNGTYLSSMNSSGEYFEFVKNSTLSFHKRTVSIASDEEKHWLNKCIESDGFIPKEEALKDFNKELTFLYY